MIDETFIKQCEQAKEIQAGHAYWKQGDYYANAMTGKVTVASGKNPISSKMVWLPTQAQLQVMLELWRYCGNEVSSLAWGVWNFYLQADDDYSPDSMEELWLGFVMKEKHGKTWDGEGWVGKK